MPARVTRDDVQRMIAEGAQVIDPLSEAEYAEERIPGAINVPQNKLTREAVAHLQKDRPVIVYCYDLE